MADIIRDAYEAKFIIENPAFQNAFGAVRDSIVSQMKSVKPRDVEMHSELIRRLQTIDSVERALKMTIQLGKDEQSRREVAAKELNYKESLFDRVTSFGVTRN